MNLSNTQGYAHVPVLSKHKAAVHCKMHKSQAVYYQVEPAPMWKSLNCLPLLLLATGCVLLLHPCSKSWPLEQFCAIFWESFHLLSMECFILSIEQS